MQMEVLESLPADIGLRRSSRPIKKPLDVHAMVIDLEDDVEDEIEEEEEWEPEPVSSAPTGGIAITDNEGTGLTNSQENVDRTHFELEEKGGPGLVGSLDNPISSWPVFKKNEAKMVKMSQEEMSAASQVLDDKNDPFATGIDENAFWQEVIALKASQKDIVDCSTVGARSQQAEFVDLTSNDSGDDGDGDMNIGDIVEEQEEIITTLSREDAALLAEVLKVIKEGGDLKKFKVESLKAYLRHHGLRMVGVKAVLLSRIQEHQKIKDGQAEKFYPRSSFFIDCKGDVCLGDTVLFPQTVYDTPFDIERRCASGSPLGKRWVAGNVVNESYGAGKQQHTFTIEVLWSTGTQPFYVMRPLKIKGRNLYRVSTLRQPWHNEAERQKVLDEKHARGAEARAYRWAIKSARFKGRSKSRQDARVHPYARNHTAEPHSIPSPTHLLEHPVQYVSIRTQDNVHQGSVSAHPAPPRTPMQHGTYTERTVYRSFTERHPAPEPTAPRGRNFHSQQSHYEGRERYPAPEPTSPRGRNFHSQRSHYEDRERYPSPEPTSPRGRYFQSQRSHYEGFTERYPAPEPTAPRGTNFHSQRIHYEGRERYPAPEPTSPRGRNFHSQRSHYEDRERYPSPEPTSPRGRYFQSQRSHYEGFTERYPAPVPTAPRGRNFQSQRSQYEDRARYPAPEPTAPRGRNFQSQENHYEGRVQAQPAPLRITVQDSMQHGWVHTERQVYQGGIASQNPAHPNHGRQHGAVPIPCSNAGCEKLGANQCISRSCASCCSKNSTSRGRCPRHR